MSCDPEPIIPDPFNTANEEYIRPDGAVSMTGPLRVVPGAANTPSVANKTDPRDGMFFLDNAIGFAIDGLLRLLIGTNGLGITVGAFTATLTHSLTQNRTYTFPEEDGTLETKEGNLVKLYITTRWY